MNFVNYSFLIIALLPIYTCNKCKICNEVMVSIIYLAGVVPALSLWKGVRSKASARFHLNFLQQFYRAGESCTQRRCLTSLTQHNNWGRYFYCQTNFLYYRNIFRIYPVSNELYPRCQSIRLFSDKGKSIKIKDWKLNKLNTNLPKSIVGNKKLRKGFKVVRNLGDKENSCANSEDVSAQKCGYIKRGLVLERHGDRLLVELENNIVVQCLQQQHLASVVVVAGDLVLVQIGENFVDRNDTGSEFPFVVDILERKSLLQRPSSASNSNKVTMKAIASNVDQLIIVSAIEPVVPFATIDQFIVAAKHYKIKDILLVINKCELEGTAEYANLMKLYETYLNYKVLLISTKKNVGLEELHQLLRAKTSVFVGQSGRI